MFRSIRFLTATFAARDPFGLGLLALIIAVVTWTLSIAFSPTMRDMAMERFHLGSDSFPVWAAHQAVPSMYMQFTNELLGDAAFDPQDPTYIQQTLNHFPARFVTFGNRLPMFFSETRQGTFEMSSTFGDTELVTRWEIQQSPDASNSQDANASPTPMVVRRTSKQWNRQQPTAAGDADE